MSNPTDTSGNVAVDFVWGNLPIQPDDLRQSSPTQTVTVGGDQNVGWTNYGTIASAKLQENYTNVTLNNLSYTVAPDNHIIANENWDSYPSVDAQIGVLPTAPAYAPITYPSGSGVISSSTVVTVPNVVGVGLQYADETLHAAGLDVVVADTTSGATAANHDTVYSQSVAAGATGITQGTAVTITVYKFHDATSNPSGNYNG